MKWHFVGVEFHRRYREGWTWLDYMKGKHLLSHWGWFTIEWKRS